jgi:hypothetical protein
MREKRYTTDAFVGLVFNNTNVAVWGTRWCSWLRHCATCWKVAGSIPDGVTGIFQ